MRHDLALFRRMRGLFWICLVGITTIAPALLVLGVGIAAKAGGFDADTREQVRTPGELAQVGTGLLMLTGLITAVIFGSTAGSVDLQRGVLRDLVLAGRTRTSIALRRIAAAWIWIALACVVSVALTALAALVTAQTTTGNDWEEYFREAAAIAPTFTGAVALCAGVAMLVGSRGAAIGIYLALAFIVDQTLLAIDALGIADGWGKVSLAAANDRLADWIKGYHVSARFDDAPHGNTGALIVFLAWCIGAIAIGTIRQSKRDL